jgi:hypothetical protein
MVERHDPNLPAAAACARQPQVPTPAGWAEIGPYAVLSLVSFLCGLVLVGLLLWKADLLVALGLTGNFYFFALLPLGLAVAGFLFGALRSFARYSGHHFGGLLELGGPVVGFTLVLVLGYLLPPPASNLSLTVYVHGKAGPQELVLRDQGSVLLDLGADRRSAKILDRGQAFFSEIPANFRRQEVIVSLDADGYELVDPLSKRRLDSASLYLAVRRKPGLLTGWVKEGADGSGNPVAGASVIVAGLSTTTNPSGHFDLPIPSDRMQDQLTLQVVATEYDPWSASVVPDGNEVTVLLTPKR